MRDAGALEESTTYSIQTLWLTHLYVLSDAPTRLELFFERATNEGSLFDAGMFAVHGSCVLCRPCCKCYRLVNFVWDSHHLCVAGGGGRCKLDQYALCVVGCSKSSEIRTCSCTRGEGSLLVQEHYDERIMLPAQSVSLKRLHALPGAHIVWKRA